MRIILVLIGLAWSLNFAYSATNNKASDLPMTKQIYKKITESTGLSLREVFNATFHEDSKSVKGLKNLAEQFSVDAMKVAFDRDVNDQEKYCLKKSPKSVCEANTKVAQNEWNKFISLYDDAKNSPESEKSLLPDLIVYNFKVQNDVLQSDKRDWEKDCGSANKINTAICKKSFAILHDPEDILEELVKVAVLKNHKKIVDFQSERKLNNRIAIYEKP